MSELDWINGEYLDAVKLAAWMRKQIDKPSPNEDRRFRAWESGSPQITTAWAADEILQKNDLHLSLLPDHLWVEAPEGNNNGPWSSHDWMKRARVLEMLEEGANYAAVSKETGVPSHTIVAWACQARAQGRLPKFREIKWKCELCNAKFSPRTATQKYCSARCRNLNSRTGGVHHAA